MGLRLVAVLVATATALLVAGCGGGGGDRRAAVDRYVRDVNLITIDLRRPLTQASAATRAFATSPAKLRREVPRLRRADATITRLERRIRRLDPPPDARRLHRLLLSLVAAEAGLVDELRDVAVALPKLDAASRSAAAPGRRLRTDLQAAHSGAEQAAALERYRASLVRPLERLRAIDAPPLVASLRTTQIETLTKLRATAAELARALRRRRPAEAAGAVRKFEAAAQTGESLPAQRARIRAITAYDAAVKRVSTLAAKVQRERDRLDRSVR